MEQVVVVNESSLLDDKQAWNIAWALWYQARFQFGPAWGLDAWVTYSPGGAQAKVPAGASVLHLLDTADQPGALGYHDEDGNEVAYARVFVKTTRDDGQQESEVASHELCELLADKHVNLSALTGDGKRLYAVEVGDPCQGNPYDVGEPEGRKTGVVVADFVLPSYFDPHTPASQPTDYRGALKGPFALGPQGYVSYIDTTKFAAGWQQQVGREHKGPVTPDRDDRLGQRGVKS